MKHLIARVARRLRQEAIRIGGTYDVVVASYGGSGTTLLANVLGRDLRVNAPNSERDGILHACSPDHPVFSSLKVSRAIYVFGNPAEAVLSIFNRGFQGKMLAKINSIHKNRAEYLHNIRVNSKPLTLDDLLRGDSDPFNIGRHLENWTTPGPTKFPILCVKYDALFDSAPIIADFVGKPGIAKSFPERRPRKTRLSDLSSDQERALLKLYEKECELYGRLPDVFEPTT